MLYKGDDDNDYNNNNNNNNTWRNTALTSLWLLDNKESFDTHDIPSLLMRILPGLSRFKNLISFGVRVVSVFSPGDPENDRITGVK